MAEHHKKPCNGILARDRCLVYLRLILVEDDPKKSMLEILSCLTNHARKHEEGTAKTGLAFLEREKYRDWKIGSTSFLWVYGKSGTGKTVLL